MAPGFGVKPADTLSGADDLTGSGRASAGGARPDI